jgi:hypothetical protein
MNCLIPAWRALLKAPAPPLLLTTTETRPGIRPSANASNRLCSVVPSTHDELIIADALIAPSDKFVALRYQQESVFSIELGDTCEGQLSAIG